MNISSTPKEYNREMNIPWRTMFSIFLLAGLFVAVSTVASHYQSDLAAAVSAGGVGSLVLFVLLTALFVIFFIPLDIVLLIPIGAHIWGPLVVALLSIAGWTLGSAVAFFLARRFGVALIGAFVPMQRLYEIEKKIPRTHMFFSVVVLRMAIPVDILSYALGLLSAMDFTSYIIATSIGVAPFGFVFAYAGSLPLREQLIAVALSFIAASGIFYFALKKPSR